MPQAIREGIFTILFISGPLVVLAAALGLAVGVLQAATQVQEQTLGSAVKVIGLFIALIIFGFYMFQYMSRYATDSINKAFKLVPTLTAKAMPRRNFLETPLHATEQKQLEQPTATEGPSGGSGGASKMAESINQPEVETINENIKANKLSQPASQVKPIPDVDKLKAQKLQQAASTPVPAKTVAVPAKPVQQVPAKPATPVATKPAPAPTPAKPAAPVAVKPAPAKPAPAKPAPVKVAPVAPVVTETPEEAKPPVTRIPRPAITGRLDKLLKEEAVR